MIKMSNMALRFLLELYALGALSYWGFKTGKVVITKIGLGIGVPLLVAIIWGIFISPKASILLPPPLRFALELSIWGIAIAALFVTKHPLLAITFGLVVGINRILMYIWEQ